MFSAIHKVNTWWRHSQMNCRCSGRPCVITWSVPQSPVLVVVKVGVSLHASTGGEGVGQEAVLTIERVPVSVV